MFIFGSKQYYFRAGPAAFVLHQGNLICGS